MANKLPWFTHDHDAHEDTWIRNFVRKQGHVAGWLWWVLLELYHNHGVGDVLKRDLADVAKAGLTSTSVVKRVLTEMATEFEGQSRLSWTLVGSELELRIPNFRKRQAKLKSKTPSRPLKTPIHIEGQGEGHKERENGLKTRTKPPVRSKAFVPPSLEEVKAYCKERGNSVDPVAFIAHYESNGWRVGKNPMRKWKSAIVTWEKNNHGGFNGKNERIVGAAAPVPGKYAKALKNRVL